VNQKIPLQMEKRLERLVFLSKEDKEGEAEFKAHLELKLSSDTKSHKKGLYRYANHKRKLGKVLLDGGHNLVTNDTGKGQIG